MKQFIGVIAGALMVASALAQSAQAPPDPKPPAADAMTPAAPQLPRASGTADSGTAARALDTTTQDEIGRRIVDRQDAAANTVEPTDSTDSTDSTASTCDENGKNKPQVHGHVSTTVVGGKHLSGSYNTAAFNVSQHFGDCDKPQSGVTVNVHAEVGKGNLHGYPWR